jgi:transcriptional regulator with XRE-family HTH domain
MEHRMPNSLRYYRKRAGLTQQEVARILSLGKRGSDSVMLWERGYRLPNIINWFKLSVLYKVSPEELYAELLKEVGKDFSKKLKRKKSGK